MSNTENKRMKNFKAAIFDMDGTLLDSMPCWELVGNKYLNFKSKEPVDGIKDILGNMSMEEAARYIKERFEIGDDFKKMITEMLMQVEGEYRCSIPLKPYAYDFLSSLAKRGIKMCIATANENALAESALKRLGADKFFEFVITCTDVGEGKNSPKIFLEACERLGASPAETAVFEDSLYAMQTAKQAGFYVVGVEDADSAPVRAKIIDMVDYYIQSFADAEKELFSL